MKGKENIHPGYGEGNPQPEQRKRPRLERQGKPADLVREEPFAQKKTDEKRVFSL